MKKFDFEETKKKRKIIECKGVKALIREETLDDYVVNEVISRNAYKKLNINEEDTILDIGANIGMFSVLAAKKGAKVYSFEPEHENCEIAQKNININNVSNKIILHEKAVVGNDDLVRPFSINPHKNKGLHSLVIKRGRYSVDVKCENINDILKRVNPTIIKMDIEGGEYEVLLAINDFRNVKELIFEFHHKHLLDVWTHTKYFKLLSHLEKHFKVIDGKRNPKSSMWDNLVYCYN